MAEGERWLAAEKPEDVERARAALAECKAVLVSGSEEVVAASSL